MYMSHEKRIVMRKKYSLILIVFALGIQAADDEQNNRFVDDLRLYEFCKISFEELV